MKDVKIGVQMMMLKQKVEESGVYKVLEELNEMGLKSIEISQIEMTPENVAEFKRACKDFDIIVASMSAALAPMMPGMKGETLTTDFDKMVADCKELDCNFLRIGMLPINLLGQKDKIIEFAKSANEMAERLAEHGIKLYYHNHHVEFGKMDGEYIMDLIRENAPSLGFELDVHWIQRAGLDPVKVIKDFKGKVDLLHLKDYRIGEVDLSALKDGDMKAFMVAFSNIVEFAELGEGNLDLKEIIEAGLESGVKHLLIEQDDTYGKDPYESLKISRNHLIELGYESYL